MTTSEILIKVAQFLLSLSFLIILHELGHFIPAKIFKTKVEKFYLFFDPWFSIFKIKKGDTEYGVGWIPLGGYCKIAGMVDESMDKEQMKQPPKPWEFRSKPTWQRLIIMVGGVTVNLILGFLIYAMMLWHWGDSYLPAKNLTYGIYADTLAQNIGLKNGDKILAVNNEPVDNFASIPGKIILDEATSLQVQRNGQMMNITIPEGFIRQLVLHKGQDFMDVRRPTIVDSVSPSAHFLQNHLQKNDHIISFNGLPANYYNTFVKAKDGLKNTPATIGLVRNGNDTVQVKVLLSEKGEVGFYQKPDNELFNIATKKYSFFAAIPAGFSKCINTLVKYVEQLRLIFVSKEVKASESLGGFISIGNLFPPFWDWQAFWSMTALLSIILAFMNILPIPALDGGHVLFLLYEVVTRRKPSQKFMEYAQIAGMAFLFLLLIYANGLDVWRHWFGGH